MTPLVEARGLTKKYKHVRALDGLDLVASDGHVVALLGPNGAGKTTFVRSVATLLRPDAGTLHVAGVDALKQPNDVRRLIGLAGQYAAVEPTMTGRENLEMIARLFGHRARGARANADAVLERLGLVEAADRRVKTYSGGMRRKLDLGASLVGAPKLLLLDEPTTGLDPRSRIELWDTIRDLVNTGTDVLLTTQYLDEADQLAQEIVIIDHGRVIAAGTPDELKSRAGQDVVEIHARDAETLAQLANALARIGSTQPRIDEGTRRLAIAVDEGPERLTEAVGIVGSLGIAIDDVALRRPTLDEVFLALTGKAPTDLETERKRTHRHRHERARTKDSLMTATITPAPTRITAPERTAGAGTTAVEVARRTVRKFARSPQLAVVGTIQGAMFLLIFRYVFGGAINTGAVPYVDFLVPGFVLTGVLFSGSSAASGVAEDLEAGFIDRLRSLPIPRSSVMAGRALADTLTATWGLAITTAIGFAVGFRLHTDMGRRWPRSGCASSPRTRSRGSSSSSGWCREPPRPPRASRCSCSR